MRLGPGGHHIDVQGVALVHKTGVATIDAQRHRFYSTITVKLRNYHMHKRKINNAQGITILEVMVAMIILSMSILLLLNMAMVAMDGNDWANNTTAATQLMQQKLEQLRTSGNLTDGADTIGEYARSWVVTNAGSHLRKIDVRVDWEDIRNRSKVDSLTAYIKSDSV
jgi:type II secretory pathway pseudopilin PulG